MTAIAKDLRQHWMALRPLLCIHNEREYDRAVKLLNSLIDEVGTMKSTLSMSCWTLLALYFMSMKNSTILCQNIVEQRCSVSSWKSMA